MSTTIAKPRLTPDEFNLLDCLHSPVLTQDWGWADSIPERIMELVMPERFMQLAMNKQYAGDAECVCFLFTAALQGPLSGDWATIYFHLSAKVMSAHFGKDFFTEIDAVKNLNSYQEQELLMKMRRWIFDKRRKELKNSVKKKLV